VCGSAHGETWVPISSPPPAQGAGDNAVSSTVPQNLELPTNLSPEVSDCPCDEEKTWGGGALFALNHRPVCGVQYSGIERWDSLFSWEGSLQKVCGNPLA